MKLGLSHLNKLRSNRDHAQKLVDKAHARIQDAKNRLDSELAMLRKAEEQLFHGTKAWQAGHDVDNEDLVNLGLVSPTINAVSA